MSKCRPNSKEPEPQCAKGLEGISLFEGMGFSREERSISYFKIENELQIPGKSESLGKMTCSFVFDIFTKLWLSSFVSSQEGGQVAGDMSLSLSTAECGQESAWRVKFRRICFSSLGNFVRDPFRSFRCNDHFPHRFMG